MLTLPRFEWLRPASVNEALAALAEDPAKTLIVAGGTDAVPNLKHGLHEPERIVHLGTLAKAASLVAGPQLRNMGTIGGNLCLDTRCTYYNQTFFWREALGFCLKKDGVHCHVVPQGKRCVAAHSSDVAPVLITLGAEVEIASPSGRRTIPVEQFFVGD